MGLVRRDMRPRKTGHTSCKEIETRGLLGDREMGSCKTGLGSWVPARVGVGIDLGSMDDSKPPGQVWRSVNAAEEPMTNGLDR